MWVNKFSYELYLVHILVISTTFYVLNRIPNFIVCIIAFLLSLAVGYVYSIIIKKMYGIFQKVK